MQCMRARVPHEASAGGSAANPRRTHSARGAPASGSVARRRPIHWFGERGGSSAGTIYKDGNPQGG
eukprot:7630008-Pyramimonas_sp.AAC.1